MMRSKASDRQRARTGAPREIGEQRPCGFGRDLVLHRDVKPGRAAVLRGEKARKPVGKASADGEKVGTGDAERDPRSE